MVEVRWMKNLVNRNEILKKRGQDTGGYSIKLVLPSIMMGAGVENKVCQMLKSSVNTRGVTRITGKDGGI